eukprot:m.144467 g.144467  ORF g.144467 m.144467 type:complete len:85 (-) comp15011_c0_seq6:27-281(-)
MFVCVYVHVCVYVCFFLVSLLRCSLKHSVSTITDASCCPGLRLDDHLFQLDGHAVGKMSRDAVLALLAAVAEGASVLLIVQRPA